MLALIAFSAASVVPCASDTSRPRLLYGATPFVDDERPSKRAAPRTGGVWPRARPCGNVCCIGPRLEIVRAALGRVPSLHQPCM
ncbi:hypothetical protein JB92DRAFT_2992257, partial [Gautieria morchelliformis]